MIKMDIVDILHQALRKHEDPRINNVSFDGDNDSNELIITMDNGEGYRDFIITNRDVREIDRNEA